jgi:hypothetical protein
MASGSIFISYRREDSAGEAGRLAEHLVRRFGADRVFIDIDTIAPGTDFVDELGRALNTTAVVIVMIGRQWLSAANADGTRRLDDANDFVRREIETALQHGTRVIPVLVQNVSMPPAASLPAELASLATRQALSIQHEEFTADTERLADAIAPLLGEAPARSAASAPARSNRGTVAGVAGVAVVAVLVLGFAAVRWQRASTAAAAAVAADRAQQLRQRAVDDLVIIATEQRDRQQLADAMTTLDRATAMDADVRRARTLQEDVAMTWIRDLKVGEGQTFADAMIRPLAVLDRAAPFAHGARQGDLLAHLGWATFLRWRDSDRNLRPAEAYQRALAADPGNPFANVMLGHWILSWEHGPDALARARQYFRTAVDAGRELGEVRRFQLAALGNDGSVESRLETVRVMNEMRTRTQPLPPGIVSSAWSMYYFALNGHASLSVSDLMHVLPPTDHLQTYRWAFEDYAQRDDGSRLQFRFYVARLRAAAGETASAADSLRVLRKELGNNSGPLRDAVDAALKELKTRNPG